MTEQKPDTVEQLRLYVRSNIAWLRFGIFMNTGAIVFLALAVGDWF